MATIEQTFAIGLQHYQSGDLQRAETYFRQILQARPSDPMALHFLGLIAMARGRADIAIPLLQQSIAGQPTNASFYCNLGTAWLAAGKLESAIDAFTHALRLDPNYAEAHNGMASVIRLQDDLDRAEAFCNRAMQLKPAWPDTYNTLGNIMQQRGRSEEAIACFRKALQVNSRHVQARNNLACTLQVLGRKQEAMDEYRRALALAPNYAQLHSNIAVLLQEEGNLDAAVAHLRESVGLQPKLANAHNNLGGVLQLQGKFDEAIGCFRTADALDPGDAGALSNILLCMNYDPKVDATALLTEHRKWGERFGNAAKMGPAADHDYDPDRPLRIGYVSADFRSHAIAHFLTPILGGHNREQVHSFCYAEVAAPDAITEQQKQLAGSWRSTIGTNDDAVAEMIRSDRIDILVDLAGHTACSRLRVFAHKPAPVQISYLGYPSTTGMESIDYCLTDSIVDPPGEAPAYVEELFRMPRAFCCYASIFPTPDVLPLPAERAGYVTFGSLHALQRLNAAVLDTWCKLLQAVPTARLLIFRDSLRGQMRDHLLRYIVSRGIAADRVSLEHKAPDGYAAVYHRIDIALDTFPWSGHTTACQALWMGVPVVTLRGGRHAGRMVASVLTHAGLPNLVADTADQYVEVAAKLAADIPALARLRAGLRHLLMTSTLGDRVGFVRDLEEAYRQVWRRRCAIPLPCTQERR